MIIIIILIIIIYFVRQHHFSHYHRQLVSLLADNVPGMHHSVESSFATFKLLTQMSTTGHDYLLLQLHTVVIQVTCTTDFVLTTIYVIRVAIGLRLGPNLCDPHVCPCGIFVNSRGTHGFSCKRGSSKLTRYAIINNLIHRALVWARIPSTMKPPVFLAWMASVLMALLESLGQPGKASFGM